MSDFNPGAGWRPTELLGEAQLIEYRGQAADDEIVSMWVRETPVPPLPTAPYTVIRVEWSPSYGRTEPSILVKQNEQGWYGDGYAGVPEVLRRDIASFEVLAEPRAVTAKAVIDRLAEITAPENILTGGAYHDIAREFGVES